MSNTPFTTNERWNSLIVSERPQAILLKAIWFVAYTLSNMTKQSVTTAHQRIVEVPLDQFVAHTKRIVPDTVGVHLMLSDDLPGQALLMMSRRTALTVVDLLLGQRIGTTKQLGSIEQSALGELGNVALSSFLNILAQPSWGALKPSPPAVVADPTAWMLDFAKRAMQDQQNTIHIIDAHYHAPATSSTIQLWILPSGISAHDEGHLTAHTIESS